MQRYNRFEVKRKLLARKCFLLELLWELSFSGQLPLAFCIGTELVMQESSMQDLDLGSRSIETLKAQWAKSTVGKKIYVAPRLEVPVSDAVNESFQSFRHPLRSSGWQAMQQ